MYNRINLTLSARTLSNRLNLGTRSLAPNASAHHGDQNLRIRQPHHGVMREGMVWYEKFPIIPTGYRIPTIPGSFFLQQQCQPSCLTGQPGQSAVAVRVESDPRPADLADRLERCAAVVGDLWSPSVAVALPERRSPRRELCLGPRFAWKPARKSGLKRAAKRAARIVVARAATNAGR